MKRERKKVTISKSSTIESSMPAILVRKLKTQFVATQHRQKVEKRHTDELRTRQTSSPQNTEYISRLRRLLFCYFAEHELCKRSTHNGNKFRSFSLVFAAAVCFLDVLRPLSVSWIFSLAPALSFFRWFRAPLFRFRFAHSFPLHFSAFNYFLLVGFLLWFVPCHRIILLGPTAIT